MVFLVPWKVLIYFVSAPALGHNIFLSYSARGEDDSGCLDSSPDIGMLMLLTGFWVFSKFMAQSVLLSSSKFVGVLSDLVVDSVPPFFPGCCSWVLQVAITTVTDLSCVEPVT